MTIFNKAVKNPERRAQQLDDHANESGKIFNRVMHPTDGRPNLRIASELACEVLYARHKAYQIRNSRSAEH